MDGKIEEFCNCRGNFNSSRLEHTSRYAILLGMRLLCLFFYRLCYSPMLHIMSDYAPPYSNYAPTCSNYALQYSSKLDMVQKLSVLFNSEYLKPSSSRHACFTEDFTSRNFLQLVWEVLDAFCWRYSPLDASCRCCSLRGIQSDA